jgi:uncharacterized protein
MNAHLRHHHARACLAVPLTAPVSAHVRTVQTVRRSLAPFELLGPRLEHRVRLTVLVAGIVALGVGVAAVVNAGIGAGPGDVVISGIAGSAGIGHGTAGIVFAAVLAGVAMLLGHRLRFGSVVLVFAVGPVVNMVWDHTPTPQDLVVQLTQLIAGLGVICAGIAATLHASYGPGNIEAIATKLSERTGRPVPQIRIGIEALFVMAGVAVGGAVGIGTVIVAVGIGPGVAVAVNVVGALLARYASPSDTVPLQPHLVRTSRL